MHGPWRDILLQAGGALAIAVALFHGVIGETTVFRHAHIEPARIRLLLRLIWQAGTVAWCGCGVLLIAAPRFDPAARHWIVLTCAAIYAAGIVGNAWVSGGRHPGWMLLSAAVALSLAGL